MEWYLYIFIFLIVIFVLAGLSIWIYQTIAAQNKSEDKKTEDKKADNPAPVNTNAITTTPTPIITPNNYKVFNNTDYPGQQDKDIIGNMHVSGFNTCNKLCDATPDCTGYVIDSSNTSYCQLKNFSKTASTANPVYSDTKSYYYSENYIKPTGPAIKPIACISPDGFSPSGNLALNASSTKLCPDNVTINTATCTSNGLFLSGCALPKRINNTQSNKYIDTATGLADFNKISIGTQGWFYDTTNPNGASIINSADSTKCLDSKGTNSNHIAFNTCDNTSRTQKWKYNNQKFVSVADTNKKLTVGQITINGRTFPTLYTDSDDGTVRSSQKFNLV